MSPHKKTDVTEGTEENFSVLDAIRDISTTLERRETLIRAQAVVLDGVYKRLNTLVYRDSPGGPYEVTLSWERTRPDGVLEEETVFVRNCGVGDTVRSALEHIEAELVAMDVQLRKAGVSEKELREDAARLRQHYFQKHTEAEAAALRKG